MTLAEALATPLVELRSYWLEARCCRVERSPLWFHAARRPQDLLSDFAFEYACLACGVMPALALLRSDRLGAPAQGWRLMVCEAFRE
ncbi:hypothetical protein WDZ11_22245 (plasmid) [Roseomonas mucosa]|uniref:hypothetical protein n=1 Tax=Roseomonas mucosa TaxID=207340 RepID=UPI0030D3BDD9